jgi:hypothetical protein
MKLKIKLPVLLGLVYSFFALQSCSENKVEPDLATQVSGSYTMEEVSINNGTQILKQNPPLGTFGIRGGDLIVIKETENSVQIKIASISVVAPNGTTSTISPTENILALSRSSQSGNTIIGSVNAVTFSFSGTTAKFVSSNAPTTVYNFKRK